MEHSISRGMVILGLLLAVGMSAAAFIFGVQAKQIGATQQTITVKGVAEKAVDATNAEWSVTLKSRGEDFASALASFVLPVPGTSSNSTCPSAIKAVRRSSVTSSFPTRTF